MENSKKEKSEDKISIRQFKSGESSYWVNQKHYKLTDSGDVIFVCGGLSDEKEIEALRAYIKRNNKVYAPSTPLIFAQEEREWTVLNHILSEDKKYLMWLKDNYDFKSSQEKLKRDIIEILK